MNRKRNFWILAKLLTVGVLMLTPVTNANAIHSTCVDDSDDVHAGAAGILIGVDPDGDDVPGPYYEAEAAVCLYGVPALESSNYYVDIDDPQPSRTGRTVQLFRCRPGDNACFELVGPTGAEVELLAPLFSCVWVDGIQQNPDC